MQRGITTEINKLGQELQEACQQNSFCTTRTSRLMSVITKKLNIQITASKMFDYELDFKLYKLLLNIAMSTEELQKYLFEVIAKILIEAKS